MGGGTPPKKCPLAPSRAGTSFGNTSRLLLRRYYPTRRKKKGCWKIGHELSCHPMKLSHNIVHPLTWPNTNRGRKLMSFSSMVGWNPFIYVDYSVELIVARKGGGGEACGYGVVPACPVPLAMASAAAAPPPPPLRFFTVSSSSSICSHSGAVPFVSLCR